MEIKFCGVTLEQETAYALRDILNEGSCERLKHLSFSSCRGFGIQKALSTDTIKTPLESIRIEATEVGRLGLDPLWLYVQHSKHLQKLQFYEASVVENSSGVLLALTTTRSLRFLELSYCIFDDPSVEIFALALAKNQSLYTLCIIAGELDDSQLACILSNLSHSKLKILKLPRNYLEQRGAVALGRLLDADSTCQLASLDLSHQHAERASKLDCNIFLQQLSTNQTLTSLNLSFCKLNNNDATVLATYLAPNQTLQDLDLRSNNIQDEGILALAEYLRSSPPLKKIFLFGNPFRETGAAALYKAIEVNTILQILNMGYTSCYYDLVQFYTCLNRGGRGLLSQDPNPAIWPLVFERGEAVSRTARGTCSDADLIFQLLHGPVLMFL
ncbi:unnamed protein product [Cylindrotheca closterium]|uniref:Uncharacterized protein n=1 Tax=Cylindrotheca closterium TaxID=2856 RepID=A0AAD2PW18_9STRA|nr:unnamed protein product [Cylindrotheca closterium]